VTLFVLYSIPSRLRYSPGTAPITGSRTGTQGASPTGTRFRHFSYAAVYGLVTTRGGGVPRNTLGLVIAVLVIILLIYLILQFI
jgi:hypothetical protein